MIGVIWSTGDVQHNRAHRHPICNHMTSKTIFATAILLAAFTSSAQVPQQGQMADHHMGASGDARQLVEFPEPMRLHTITSMRDHLLALQEINMALSKSDFATAARVAEQRLGMSSLALHGASHIAPFMPKGMQDTGTEMHHAASRFAVAAENASVGSDVRPALAALGDVMSQCVACHAAYRLH